jgi:hypothetical protein
LGHAITSRVDALREGDGARTEDDEELSAPGLKEAILRAFSFS